MKDELHGTSAGAVKDRLIPRWLLLLVLAAVLFGCAAKSSVQGPVSPAGPEACDAAENGDQAPVDESDTPEALPDPDDQNLDPELTVEAEEAQIGEDGLTPEQEHALASESAIKFDLDVRETKEFLYYFKFYTAKYPNGKSKKGRRAFERWLKRAAPFLPYVRQAIRENGLPEDLIFLPFAESGYNPWAYSHAGAAGMWQFMRSTGRLYGLKVDWWIDQRRDPYLATQAAIAYLTKLHGMFGDWYLALAAYNAGEGKVSRAIRKSGSKDYFTIAQSRRYLKKETRHYVPKILAILKIVQNLEELGFEPIDWDVDPGIRTVQLKGGTDLMGLARACGLSWKEFHRLNPAFRRTVSPPGMEVPVYLPQDKLLVAEAFIAKEGSRPYAGYRRYKIRSGDSWWRIARRSGVPISVLKKVNNTRSNTLRPGQYIMLPGSGSGLAVASVDAPGVARPANYRVRKGDTLWTIARRYGVSVNSICQKNGISRHRPLSVGQQLHIPGAGETLASTSVKKTQAIAKKRANYVVRKGDTLWDISRSFGVSVSSICRANGITTRTTLRVGRTLYIPGAGGAETRIAAEEAKQANKVVTYKVRRGDNLWTIARRYNVTTKSLLAANNLTTRSVLRPGQTLKIYLD